MDWLIPQDKNTFYWNQNQNQPIKSKCNAFYVILKWIKFVCCPLDSDSKFWISNVETSNMPAHDGFNFENVFGLFEVNQNYEERSNNSFGIFFTTYSNLNSSITWRFVKSKPQHICHEMSKMKWHLCLK